MHIEFHSSHTSGDFASGRLVVRLVKEMPYPRQTERDEVYFTVPPDFHTHNDCVAAALMTLVGDSYRDVTFNFPVSSRCAELLRDYYRLDSVGPVDPTLEPRRPGTQLALNFSGGFDSLALWWVLTHDLDVAFKVVTSEYVGAFAHERSGYQLVHRDVSCRTDLRLKRYDRHGRFHAAVPLLYAEYLDLKGLASAHTLRQEASDYESLKDGRAPAFLAMEAAYLAGGVEEVHLVRCVHWRALQKVLVLAAPHLLERALHASSRPGFEKFFIKGHSLRAWHEDLGLELPPFLRSIPEPSYAVPLARWDRNFTQGLEIARRHGRDMARLIAPWIDDFDLARAEGLTFGFLRKYNTNFIHYIPEPLKNPMLKTFHRYGIFPYDERDWYELEIVDGFRRDLHAVRRQRELAAGGRTEPA